MAEVEHESGLLVTGYADPVDDVASSDSPSPDLKRKQAAVLYADIADYTCFNEQDEESAHHRLLEAVRIMMSQVSENNGHIAHLAGGAMLAEFKDADSALHCAINVQLSIRQWNATSNVDCPVLFRIGVNLGDVISGQDDTYGNAVNLVAKLEKLASAGGICVSESVMNDLESQPTIRFVTKGKQYAKSIGKSVHAFWIEFDSRHAVEPGHTNAVRVSALTS